MIHIALSIFSLINTAQLYTSASNIASGGTLPKMSFTPMKEEASRYRPGGSRFLFPFLSRPPGRWCTLIQSYSSPLPPNFLRTRANLI